jgi:maltose alpha-D-glucosyltransferase/alpha-amylase
MKRMIAVRRGRRSFGRGTLRFLYPSNRHILVYLREHEGETVLCVANLSRSAQGVELDLGQFRGRVPVELTGQSSFPPIGELPYFVTLPGYGFYWFLLSAEAEPPVWHVHMPGTASDLLTLVVREGLADLLAGPCRRILERDVLPPFLPLRRWFAEKDVGLASVEMIRWVELATSRGIWLLALAAAKRSDGEVRTYHLPLAVAWDAGHDAATIGGHALARLRRGRTVGLLTDAFHDDDFLRALVEVMRDNADLPALDGRVLCHSTRALSDLTMPDQPAVERIGSEQSNSSAIVGGAVVVKLIRRPVDGPDAEVEMGRFLTESSRFPNTPPLLGWAEMADGAGRSQVLAVMHGHVANQGPAWDWVLAELERFLDEASLIPPERLAERIAAGLLDDMLDFARVVGQRTAEMHRALAVATGDPAFDPVPVVEADLERWRLRTLDQARGALDVLRRCDLPEGRALAEDPTRLFLAVDERVPKAPFGLLMRIHGDYHLGQLLVAKEDVHVIDFEGEPNRPVEQRRAKDSPLRDVAGLLRSLDYAMWTTLLRMAAARPEVPARLDQVTRDWRARASDAFLQSYFMAALEGAGLPLGDPAARTLLDLFLIEKACYEVRYEAANRPALLAVPLKGLLAMMGS